MNPKETLLTVAADLSLLQFGTLIIALSYVMIFDLWLSMALSLCKASCLKMIEQKGRPPSERPPNDGSLWGNRFAHISQPLALGA